MSQIQNDHLRIQVHDGAEAVWFSVGLREADGTWTNVLLSGTWGTTSIWSQDRVPLCEDPEVEWQPTVAPRRERHAGIYRTATATASQIELEGHCGPHRVVTCLALAPDQTMHVTTRVQITEPTRLGKCLNHLYFAPEGRLAHSCLPLDFAWLPALHQLPDHVCADHFFRAPVAMVMARGYYAALLPDLDAFRDENGMPCALDLRVTDTLLEGPRLSYGLCHSEPDGHVYFAYRPETAPRFPPTELAYSFRILVGRSDAPAHIVPQITAHQWQTHGHLLMSDPRPQVLPFVEYGRRYTFQHELPARLRTVHRNGTACTGIENRTRRGAQFHAWENDMHMGYGLRYYGLRLPDSRLQNIATGMLNLMRHAPRTRGAFPCIFNFDTEQYEGSLFWTARSADARHGYDTAAMGVTMWWLLKWIEDFADPDRATLLELATAYCDFLMQEQLPSGAIPTYFGSDLTPAPQLRESATTAISGAVLAKCAHLVRNPAYTRAAMQAGYFMEAHCLPGLDFNDFETFYSCSPKPLHAMDHWSGLRPHNNLSMGWACDMYLALYQRTGEELWLDSGRYLLSILSLYQQVWNPSHLKGYLFGGFGVMNTDGEWNDGRQARFASVYTDYYLATGHTEYLERAVAACRAAFALMDMRENHANGINDVVMPHLGAGLGYAPENIHHGGADSGYGWSGMNWSAAGGLAASAYLERHLGTVFLDMAHRTAHAIDGVAVQVGHWHDDSVELQVQSALRSLPLPFAEEREIVIRAGGWDWTDQEPKDFTLRLNGEPPLRVATDDPDIAIRYRLSA